MTANEISERIAALRKKMDHEAGLVKRDPQSIRLIGICKHQPIDKIRTAMQCGLQDFGQNYVQELAKQAPELNEDFHRVNWHFVGSLQRNKVKDLLKLFSKAPPLIHTLSRPELARTIHDVAAKNNQLVSCLIQVLPEAEFSNPEERNGCPAEEVAPLLTLIKDLPHVCVKGLMILPPLEENPEEARRHFRFLRNLGETLSQHVQSLSCERIELREYSMGMTADMKEAIQEGATYVRIGTGIFGAREKR